MTPEKLDELAALQRVERLGEIDSVQRRRLEHLRTELAREGQETADDKSTLFTDESRRPQLDGTDWNDGNNAACRGEVAAIGLKYGLPLIKLAVESLLKG